MKGPDVKPHSGLPDSTASSFVERLQRRDRDAWVRLAKLYGPLVYSWCRRRGLDEEDAADVAQEVFRTVAGGIDKFTREKGGTFRGWLWTVTRSRIVDHYRRVRDIPKAMGGSDAQARINEIPESFDDEEPEESASGDMVHRVLALIQPEFKATTWQAFWRVMMNEELPAQVADALGISVNAVYIAKSRVLRRLRDEMENDRL